MELDDEMKTILNNTKEIELSIFFYNKKELNTYSNSIKNQLELAKYEKFYELFQDGFYSYDCDKAYFIDLKSNNDLFHFRIYYTSIFNPKGKHTLFQFSLKISNQDLEYHFLKNEKVDKFIPIKIERKENEKYIDYVLCLTGSELLKKERRKNIECDICFQKGKYFYNSSVFECQHKNFCVKCLFTHQITSVGEFKCPFCRAKKKNTII